MVRSRRPIRFRSPRHMTRRTAPTSGVHDGRVVTDAPNLRWGTDATMAWTRSDGWGWVFVLLDHHTDEAWAHVAKVGNRFAALQPVSDAVIDRFDGLGPDVARGIKAGTTGQGARARDRGRACRHPGLLPPDASYPWPMWSLPLHSPRWLTKSSGWTPMSTCSPRRPAMPDRRR